MRNAGGCDVPAFRIADNRSVSICPSEAPAHIVRDVRRGIRDDGVSTGSGSDRVSTHATVEIAKTVTRSLPLAVLTQL
jgi:hypothetical protein